MPTWSQSSVSEVSPYLIMGLEGRGGWVENVLQIATSHKDCLINAANQKNRMIW